MVHAATFEDVLAKVAETYREMVPAPAPAPKPEIVEIVSSGPVYDFTEPVEAALMVSTQCEWPAPEHPVEWPARGTATEPADDIQHHVRMPSGAVAAPADAQDAPEASEAGESETGDQAGSAEPAKPRRGRPPKVA